MTKEELEKEATEYALEWGEKTDGTYACCRDGYLAAAEPREKRIADLEKENAELKSIAENQQSSNMSRYFENKKLKEGLVVGSTFNKALNSMNKNLEEERDKYRNMVFDKDDQLTKAKEIITKIMQRIPSFQAKSFQDLSLLNALSEAEQFLKEVEK